MSRMTIASTNARIDALASDVAEIKTMLQALAPVDAPAKARVRTAPAKTARAKKATTPKAQPKAAPVRKGAQTREALSRKDWNRTLTTRARFAGGSAYADVMGAWDRVQALRAENATPEEAFFAITGLGL